jgi:hypothetical protein
MGLEEWHPSILATKANAEDHPTWNEAMNGPFANGSRKACELEYNTLEEKDCWDVVDRPLDRPVISGTWAFRIKRFPDGSIRKLEARVVPGAMNKLKGWTI